MGRLGGSVNFRFRSRGSAIGDVVADRAVEQPRILQYHADVSAQLGAWHRTDVDAVEENAASGQFVKSHDEIDQGRLPGPGWSDNGHRMTRFSDEREVADQRPGRVVAERDAFKFDPSTRRPQHAVGIGAFLAGASSTSNTRSAEATPDCTGGCELARPSCPAGPITQSGCGDLNPGPPAPKAGGAGKLRYIPCLLGPSVTARQLGEVDATRRDQASIATQTWRSAPKDTT